MVQKLTTGQRPSSTQIINRLMPKMSGALTKHQPVVGGGDDLDDGLELDPTMLADSDVEGGSDDEAPVGGAVLEDEEDAFDLQQDDEEVVDEDGKEDRPQKEGSKKRKAGGDSEAELEKKRRKKEKEKERKARVSISAPLAPSTERTDHILNLESYAR